LVFSGHASAIASCQRGVGVLCAQSAVGRMRVFARQRDFEAFEEVIARAKERLPIRVLAWCVMPDHWHVESPASRPRQRGRRVGRVPAAAAPTLAATRANSPNGSRTGVTAPVGDARYAVRRALVAAAHREATEPPIHPTSPRPPLAVARQVEIKTPDPFTVDSFVKWPARSTPRGSPAVADRPRRGDGRRSARA